MSKPEVPGKPAADKKTRKPRGSTKSLKLTDAQVAECTAIAADLGDPEWGTVVKPMAVASKALVLGLVQLRAEVRG
jgi:hypothetical protein